MPAGWQPHKLLPCNTRMFEVKQIRRVMDASLETLLLCGGAIVVISVVRAIANYWSAIAFALIGSRIAADLRARTFRHVQSLSMRHHTRASSGDTPIRRGPW